MTDPATAPLAPGTVTAADLYRELVSMRADVASALTHLQIIEARNKNADELHHDHETRLRILESFRAKVLGISISVGFASGILSGSVGFLLGHLR